MNDESQNNDDGLWPLLERSSDGVLIVAPKPWRVVRVNAIVAEWLHTLADSQVGRPVAEMFDSESAPGVVAELDAALSGSPPNEPFLVFLLSATGCEQPAACEVCKLASGMFGVLLRPGVTPSGLPERIDPLTSLLDRRYLTKRLAKLLRAAGTLEEKFAVLFVDLDDFKAVNDRYGHLVGDKVLEQAAKRINTCLNLGNAERVVRYGGDEFVVLIESVSNSTRVDEVAAAIHNAFVQPAEVPGSNVKLTASIGVAWGPGEFRSPEEVLAAADRAMYVAKRQP